VLIVNRTSSVFIVNDIFISLCGHISMYFLTVVGIFTTVARPMAVTMVVLSRLPAHCGQVHIPCRCFVAPSSIGRRHP
jgi:hypothetical protein